MRPGHSCGRWPSGQRAGEGKQGLGPAQQAPSQAGAVAPRWGHCWGLTEHRHRAGAWRGEASVPQHRVFCQDFCMETGHWADLSSGMPSRSEAWMPHAQTHCHALGTRTGIKNPPPPSSQPQGGSWGARLPGLLTPGLKVSVVRRPAGTRPPLSGLPCFCSLQLGRAGCPPGWPERLPRGGHTHIGSVNREWGHRAIPSACNLEPF